jgi:hypothetical protein
VLSLAFGSAALAQTSTMDSVVTKKTTKTGTIVSVAGNKVVLQEADGNHEYKVPQGFKVQVGGQDVGVDQLKPGMKVSAVITDQIITRDVTITKVVQGTVMQVAPGGIVVKDPKNNYVSYNFKDPDGNDVYYLKPDGNEASLRDVKEGDRLTGTFVTKLPPQTIDQRSVKASAVAPPPPPAAEPAAPPAVAVATPVKKKLPKTGSPLPLLGLVALVSVGIALSLRGARSVR